LALTPAPPAVTALAEYGRTRYEVRTTAMPASVGTITSAP
jgi:hypothetical protein